jgi:predicted nucleic-acid-binding protein
MCKVLLVRRLHAKVTTLIVQNFQEVANPHKIYVPHEDYLELVVNLSNLVLCIGVLH